MISPALRDRIFRFLPAAVYLAAAAAFVKNRFSLLDFPLDDAWIHQVYSKSFAFGHGFAYNSGQPEAGSTSPLWSILTAPAQWLEGIDAHLPTLAVKAIGILLGLACVLILRRIVFLLTRSRGAGVAAAALFALEPKLHFSAFSGMETNLAVALLAGACLARMENRNWLFLALIGLAPAARPEAAIFLPAAAAGIRPIWRSTRSVRAALVAGLLPALPALVWAGFCFRTTGHGLPNTFYLKAHAFAPTWAGLQTGALAASQFGIAPAWLLVAGAVAFGFLCRKNGGKGAIPFLFLLALPILHVAGVVLSRPFYLSGYYWTRWTDPGALLLAAAFCAGGAAMLTPPPPGSEAVPAGPRPAKRTGYYAAWILFAAFLVPAFCASFAERRARLASDSRAIAILNVRMGKWIREHTPENAVVGVNDAGAIRYFGQRRTIDLIGLNNADIAFGKLGMAAAVSRCDWLTVFPALLESTEELVAAAREFEPRFATSIPFAEYTVCNAPWQTVQVALRRK